MKYLLSLVVSAIAWNEDQKKSFQLLVTGQVSDDQNGDGIGGDLEPVLAVAKPGLKHLGSFHGDVRLHVETAKHGHFPPIAMHHGAPHYDPDKFGGALQQQVAFPIVLVVPAVEAASVGATAAILGWINGANTSVGDGTHVSTDALEPWLLRAEQTPSETWNEKVLGWHSTGELTSAAARAVNLTSKCGLGAKTVRSMCGAPPNPQGPVRELYCGLLSASFLVSCEWGANVAPAEQCRLGQLACNAFSRVAPTILTGDPAKELTGLFEGIFCVQGKATCDRGVTISN